MKFVYTDHFKVQLKKRRITVKIAKGVYLKAKERYFDTYTNHKIAISKVKFKKRYRKLMLAYDTIETEVHFVTAYPLRQSEIENRLKKGRWINEKN